MITLVYKKVVRGSGCLVSRRASSSECITSSHTHTRTSGQSWRTSALAARALPLMRPMDRVKVSESEEQATMAAATLVIIRRCLQTQTDSPRADHSH